MNIIFRNLNSLEYFLLYFLNGFLKDFLNVILHALSHCNLLFVETYYDNLSMRKGTRAHGTLVDAMVEGKRARAKLVTN